MKTIKSPTLVHVWWPQKQQVGFAKRNELDWFFDKGDEVTRREDQMVWRLADEQPTIRPSDADIEITGDHLIYFRCQEPEIYRRWDDEYIERLPDMPATVRPSDNATAERTTDNPEMRRQ
jgi:hypothetical protein